MTKLNFLPTTKIPSWPTLFHNTRSFTQSSVSSGSKLSVQPPYDLGQPKVVQCRSKPHQHGKIHPHGRGSHPYDRGTSSQGAHRRGRGGNPPGQYRSAVYTTPTEMNRGRGKGREMGKKRSIPTHMSPARHPNLQPAKQVI